MKTSRRFVGLLALCALLPACEIFEDQTPKTMSFRMDGQVGDTITIIYSKQFVAGTDETGVTQVRVIAADTVKHRLPIDTILDIQIERQMFIEALTFERDTVDVDVLIDVNDRSIFGGSGTLLPEVPWYFLYRFNQRPTQTIEVVI
jgi:hypothetical protein